MKDPCVIYVGNVDALQANKDVTQTIHVVQVLHKTYSQTSQTRIQKLENKYWSTYKLPC
jgi:hypothetical protein